jgi:hypothetical protein
MARSLDARSRRASQKTIRSTAMPAASRPNRRENRDESLMAARLAGGSAIDRRPVIVVAETHPAG